jgi:hypothetical protein
MTLRRPLLAALAALPVALGLAVYTARPRTFTVDLSAEEVDRQLFERNDG